MLLVFVGYMGGSRAEMGRWGKRLTRQHRGWGFRGLVTPMPFCLFTVIFLSSSALFGFVLMLSVEAASRPTQYQIYIGLSHLVNVGLFVPRLLLASPILSWQSE